MVAHNLDISTRAHGDAHRSRQSERLTHSHDLLRFLAPKRSNDFWHRLGQAVWQGYEEIPPQETACYAAGMAL
ncbi:hypothetical protein TcasGA2_TC007909 [Tribolium castaneum]|uniref:Uncharacterized protein n=1 Tax=Tribolium castaneum TaxID=7070 RepID=D2A302_TRICA|nr:hypothetical protein TcasGA2_TC007909 [Tribolium castaneum]